MRGVRFMACFRFKMWWMAQRMGDKGGDVPHETQFLLVESRGPGAGEEEEDEASYVDLAAGFRFAPVGLVDMFNGGAAVEGLTYSLLADGEEAVGLVSMEVRGRGRFGAYSSVRPRSCTLGSSPVEFSYDASSGMVILELESMPLPKERVHRIAIEL
ncbi:hypothetical protein TRIUR3_24629 [Triticum urartu]|uniref:Uncharacterized protein n=1 Tax=Triticum urartu TaxID=4572 RepID=M7Y5P9_TRIUA|nr:hypothetical protein TRIUR3_24629 [Triticum urartu]